MRGLAGGRFVSVPATGDEASLKTLVTPKVVPPAKMQKRQTKLGRPRGLVVFEYCPPIGCKLLDYGSMPLPIVIVVENLQPARGVLVQLKVQLRHVALDQVLR